MAKAWQGKHCLPKTVFNHLPNPQIVNNLPIHKHIRVVSIKQIWKSTRIIERMLQKLVDSKYANKKYPTTNSLALLGEIFCCFNLLYVYTSFPGTYMQLVCTSCGSIGLHLALVGMVYR